MSTLPRTARLAIATLAAATGLAQAQTAPAAAAAPAIRTERTLSSEVAGQIAAAAVAACQASGYAVAATVVDRAGGVRALLRADAAGPHTLEASRLKAYTSASARSATLAMMESAQKNPGAANLVNIPGFLLLGGGVPVKAGNEVIGAVGVGGAPDGHLDEQCALAALDKVRAQLQ